MKVILQKDVKNLGQVGDVVSVKKGYARHFLLPRKWAMIFTKGRQSEVRHRQTVIESKKKKAIQQRKTLVEKLKDVSLTFEKQIDDKGRLFGSVNAVEISKTLEEQGYSIDKKYIKLPIALKEMGTHKVLLQWNKDLKTHIEVMISPPAAHLKSLERRSKKKSEKASKVVDKNKL